MESLEASISRRNAYEDNLDHCFSYRPYLLSSFYRVNSLNFDSLSPLRSPLCMSMACVHSSHGWRTSTDFPTLVYTHAHTHLIRTHTHIHLIRTHTTYDTTYGNKYYIHTLYRNIVWMVNVQSETM